MSAVSAYPAILLLNYSEFNNPPKGVVDFAKKNNILEYNKDRKKSQSHTIDNEIPEV